MLKEHSPTILIQQNCQHVSVLQLILHTSKGELVISILLHNSIRSENYLVSLSIPNNSQAEMQSIAVNKTDNWWNFCFSFLCALFFILFFYQYFFFFYIAINNRALDFQKTRTRDKCSILHHNWLSADIIGSLSFMFI